MSLSITGLTNFICEIRTCSTFEEEQEVVELEKQKIREEFAKDKEGKMKGYTKMKSLWKMVYINLLGHSTSFSHQRTIDLIQSEKLSEKYTGYVALSVLVSETEVGILEEAVPAI